MPAETEVSVLNPLMKKALEKIAFLLFGFLVDRWRWEVFAGNIKPEDYNKRALCMFAGHEGPLNTCSIFGSEAAGARLDAMMRMGLSEPWPVAYRLVTGFPEMDAGAILYYFEPLSVWLKAENVRRGYTCGW